MQILSKETFTKVLKVIDEPLTGPEQSVGPVRKMSDHFTEAMPQSKIV